MVARGAFGRLAKTKEVMEILALVHISRFQNCTADVLLLDSILEVLLCDVYLYMNP